MRYPPAFVAREARVRREYADLYEGWDVRNWAPAAQVAALIATGLRNGQSSEPRRRLLPEDQFEFRGCAPRRPGLRARTRRSD
jgi:hypothetical protein